MGTQNEPIAVTLVGAVTGVVGYVFRWLLVRRSKSGSVDTTEADSLWRDQKEFRDSILNEAERLRAETQGLRRDVLAAFEESLHLRRALVDAQVEAKELRLDAHRLRNQLAGAEGAAALLVEQVKGLGAKPVIDLADL